MELVPLTCRQLDLLLRNAAANVPTFRYGWVQWPVAFCDANIFRGQKLLTSFLWVAGCPTCPSPVSEYFRVNDSWYAAEAQDSKIQDPLSTERAWGDSLPSLSAECMQFCDQALNCEVIQGRPASVWGSYSWDQCWQLLQWVGSYDHKSCLCGHRVPMLPPASVRPGLHWHVKKTAIETTKLVAYPWFDPPAKLHCRWNSVIREGRWMTYFRRSPEPPLLLPTVHEARRISAASRSAGQPKPQPSCEKHFSNLQSERKDRRLWLSFLLACFCTLEDMFCTLVLGGIRSVLLPSKSELAKCHILCPGCCDAWPFWFCYHIMVEARPFLNDFSPLIVLNSQRHSVGKMCAV